MYYWRQASLFDSLVVDGNHLAKARILERQEKPNKDLKELSELYLFEEFYRFLRESTGIAITALYLALILFSMTYLYVLFGHFDISIVKYVTFEDILATPIKNPNIIVVFAAIFFFLYVADLGSRFRARQQIKYANTEKKPFTFKILQVVLWTPKRKKANIKVTLLITTLCLCVFIVSFARLEASGIEKGQGPFVEISLGDDQEAVKSTLLGTTINYVFTYDHVSNESMIFAVESIQSMKLLATLDSTDAPPETQSEEEKASELPQVEKTADG